MRSISGKLSFPGGPPDARPLPKDVLKLRLATPMMGGGVKAGEVDIQRPIRASSIRGNLRFWWRLFCEPALRGEALRKAEPKVWGSTETPSPVGVSVECSPLQDAGMRKYAPRDAFGFKSFGTENYALFPAAASGNEHDVAREGLTFTLTITCADKSVVDQVRTALAAWIYFGGIGARTRRGLGTLELIEQNLSDGAKLPGVKELLQKNTDVVVWYGDQEQKGMEAWQKALKDYKDYRQQRTNNRGRSFWPEPDSLRALKHASDPRHKAPFTPDHIPAFPRAVLGLPIVFHFKDGCDPKDTLLTGVRQEGTAPVNRMASPVITKGICENGKWRAAVIILPRKDALAVRPFFDRMPPSHQVIPVQDDRYKRLPKNTMRGKTNAITGFEAYISEKGYRKEGPR